jgi:hypothetical protein
MHFMKSKITAAGTVVLLLVSYAWAADVAGKWTAHVAGAQGQGDSDITLVLKVADDKLTGTINNSLAPGEVEIQDGKVTGDEISFSLKRNIGGADMTVQWKGKIAGDEIKFSRTTQGAAGGPATEITAKRAK